mmetsp:Transcript_16699/g.57555  ORF Transcript_16699/g.57555 Transcript_16699/m.57555 type:complete len:471 (+) Transcript_16699:601-2013(+)
MSPPNGFEPDAPAAASFRRSSNFRRSRPSSWSGSRSPSVRRASWAQSRVMAAASLPRSSGWAPRKPCSTRTTSARPYASAPARSSARGAAAVTGVVADARAMRSLRAAAAQALTRRVVALPMMGTDRPPKPAPPTWSLSMDAKAVDSAFASASSTRTTAKWRSSRGATRSRQQPSRSAAFAQTRSSALPSVAVAKIPTSSTSTTSPGRVSESSSAMGLSSPAVHVPSSTSWRRSSDARPGTHVDRAATASSLGSRLTSSMRMSNRVSGAAPKQLRCLRSRRLSTAQRASPAAVAGLASTTATCRSRSAGGHMSPFCWVGTSLGFCFFSMGRALASVDPGRLDARVDPGRLPPSLSPSASSSSNLSSALSKSVAGPSMQPSAPARAAPAPATASPSWQEPTRSVGRRAATAHNRPKRAAAIAAGVGSTRSARPGGAAGSSRGSLGRRAGLRARSGRQSSQGTQRLRPTSRQ